MARMVSRSRGREGRGLGERLSELIIYVLIGAALILALRWYLVDFRHSPNSVLLSYLAAMRSGRVQSQYELLSDSTRLIYPSARQYDLKFALAHGLTGRLTDYLVTNMAERGGTAEADVSVTIRKPKQELYQSATDSYTDHYILKRQKSGWKVVLEASKLDSLKAIENR